MESFTREELWTAVELSSVCMGVYHAESRRITEPNRALRHRLKGDGGDVVIVASDPGQGRIYGRLRNEGTPLSLRVVSTGANNNTGCSLVEVSLAHAQNTQDALASSDMVHLVDMASDGIWEWFPSLQYEFIGSRFWNILGYESKHRKPEEISPNAPGWTGINNPKHIAAAVERFRDHVATRGMTDYSCNVSYIHRDGHEVDVKCRGAVVEWLPDGTPWRMLGTHTDITNIKRAVEAKAQLVSRISHEIRTPICAILNECETFEGNTSTAIISDSCEQLLALCNDVLMINKMGGPAEISATTRSSSVEDFFDKRHAAQVRKKGLALEKTVLMVSPVPLMMDVTKCNQVVDNLMSNAVKFTAPGGRLHLELNCIPPTGSPQPALATIGTTPCASSCNAQASGCCGEKGPAVADGTQWLVEITVSDTGQGIPPDFESSAFTEFAQANSSEQGAGLGLSIARELARLMHGDVSLKKTVLGEGSIFFFSFPAAIAPSPGDEEQSPASPPPKGITKVVNQQSSERPQEWMVRILSADDMQTNRKVMRRRLRSIEERLEGVQVEVVDAVNGAAAVNTFRENGPFDMVFMDCLMPEMDGFTASKEIHRLCKEQGMQPVPVVAVTASVSMTLHQDCLDAGMGRVIIKPFVMMDLMPIFQAAVDARHVESYTVESVGQLACGTSGDREDAKGQSPPLPRSPETAGGP